MKLINNFLRLLQIQIHITNYSKLVAYKPNLKVFIFYGKKVGDGKFKCQPCFPIE